MSLKDGIPGRNLRNFFYILKNIAPRKFLTKTNKRIWRRILFSIRFYILIYEVPNFIKSQNRIFRELRPYFCKKNKILYQMRLLGFIKNFRGGIYFKIIEKIPLEFSQIPERNFDLLETA